MFSKVLCAIAALACLRVGGATPGLPGDSCEAAIGVATLPYTSTQVALDDDTLTVDGWYGPFQVSNPNTLLRVQGYSQSISFKVIQGDCTSGVTVKEIGSFQGFASIDFVAQPAQTYYVYALAYDYKYTLSISDPRKPSNDFRANAIPIELGQTVVGSTFNATDGVFCSQGVKDIWYTFTPSTDGFVDYTVASIPLLTGAAVAFSSSRTDCTFFLPNDGHTPYPVTAGKRYLVAVGFLTASGYPIDAGVFSLNVNMV